MKKLFYPLTLALTLLATSCTNNQDDMTTPTDPSGKTPISFSVEENRKPITRAGFTADTKIAMRIKSENKTDNKTLYTRTIASASEASGAAFSSITIDNNYKRYWDDAYGRNALLSVFAIAVPGKTDAENDSKTLENKLAEETATKNAAGWFTETTENEKISWTVSKTQNSTTLVDEDLTFSNNIKDGGENGIYRYDFSSGKYSTYSEDLDDGRMLFYQPQGAKPEDPGKFDQGHLIFNHALCRMSVTLTKGSGFESAPFTLTSNQVTFKLLPYTGKLNLINGTWSDISSDDITATATANSSSYSLTAQVIPNYEISKTRTNVNMLEFTIDNNVYHITQAQMYDALSKATGNKDKMTTLDNDKVTLENGLNYIFNVTVNKTKVTVTASVAGFTEVTAANQGIDNSLISLSLLSNGTTANNANFDWYRLNVSDDGSTTPNWGGNYKDKATLTNVGGIYVPSWYFENNTSFYHFRVVSKGTVITNDDTNKNDYFAISSESSQDYQWGAPFISSATSPFNYNSSTGYASYISPAIKATKSTISMTALHMMSNIKVVLATTTGGDKVDLANSKVYISKYYKNGKVLMGNGLVSTTGDVSTTLDELTTSSTSATAGQFTYAVVPQAISRGTSPIEYVEFTIETKDNNRYVVSNLASITAQTNGGSQNQTVSQNITFWYPNHSYTYTFTLTKTGITNVTASVQDWVNVTAETPVTLE